MENTSDATGSWVIPALGHPVIARWVPERLRAAGPAARVRAQVLVAFTLLLIGGTVALSALYLALGLVDLIAPLAMAAAVGVALVGVLARTGSFVYAGNLCAAALWLGVSGTAALSGGMGSPSLAGVCIVPMAGLIFAGTSSGVAWTVVSVGTVVAIYALQVSGFPFVTSLPEDLREVHDAATVAALVLFVAGALLVDDEVRGWLARHRDAAVSTRNQAILNAAGDAIIVVDTTGVVRAANNAAGDLLERAPWHLIGEALDPLVRGWQARAPDGGGPVSYAAWALRSGSQIPVEVTAGWLGGDGDRVLLLRDITEGHAADLAMEEARDRAVAASEAKRRFLATMSHELRTPLTAVIGYAELMLDEVRGGNPVQDPGDLQSVSEAGRHLLTLVDGVLDLARIESGRMPVEREPVRVGELLVPVDAAGRTLAARRRNSWTIDRQPGLDGLLVTTDAALVGRILIHLVSNAARFTERGRISLEVGATPLGVRFTVQDSGIGMRPEQVERVWEAFALGEDEDGRGLGGSGLGLPLSRALAELLGGTLRLDSAPGRGTCVELFLPTR